MEWEDDPQGRAPMTEAIDTIADLRRQLENAKLSEGYALQTVANLHKEVAEAQAEIERLREANVIFASMCEALMVRMTRARDIITIGAPTRANNWGILDVTIDKQIFDEAKAALRQEE